MFSQLPDSHSIGMDFQDRAWRDRGGIGGSERDKAQTRLLAAAVMSISVAPHPLPLSALCAKSKPMVMTGVSNP